MNYNTEQCMDCGDFQLKYAAGSCAAGILYMRLYFEADICGFDLSSGTTFA